MTTMPGSEPAPSRSRCARCALPARYPGIRLAADGDCNYCATHDVLEPRRARDREVVRREVEALIAATLGGDAPGPHAVVAYGGGRNATVMLRELRRRYPTLRLLAHTLDHGLLGPATWRNIERVTRALEVELVVTRPDPALVRSLLRLALTTELPFPRELRALGSTAGLICLGMAIGTSVRRAIADRVPLAFVGAARGQLPLVTVESWRAVGSCLHLADHAYKDDPLDILKLIADPLREHLGEAVDAYVLRSQYVAPGSFRPAVVFPFHALWAPADERDEDALAELGWERPGDVDATSTSSQLHGAGARAFERRYGYHPSSGELSARVRDGTLPYAAAIAALTAGPNHDALRQVSATLGLPLDDA